MLFRSKEIEVNFGHADVIKTFRFQFDIFPVFIVEVVLFERY